MKIRRGEDLFLLIWYGMTLLQGDFETKILLRKPSIPETSIRLAFVMVAVKARIGTVQGNNCTFPQSLASIYEMFSP